MDVEPLGPRAPALPDRNGMRPRGRGRAGEPDDPGAPGGLDDPADAGAAYNGAALDGRPAAADADDKATDDKAADAVADAALPDPAGPGDPAGSARERRGWRRLLRRVGAVEQPVTIGGVARVDRRTKALVKRLEPGEVAVINHADLDRVAAETLVDAQPAAVLNVAASVTGRYPNLGPLVLCQAGIPLVDDIGPALLEVVRDGDPVAVAGADVIVGGEVVATGRRQTVETIDVAVEAARLNMGPELGRFAENTVEYAREEIEALTGDITIPDVACRMAGRHVLIVVRGLDYKEDLGLLQRSGYLKEVRPVLIGVDGGADALLEIGATPDVIIGDFDSVSEATLRCGAELIVHGFVDGRAPGADRLDEMGLPYTVFSAPGTSEDIAMLLAYEKGAELLVAVGSHFSMVEFLDKGRSGMASTLLVRMKVGSVLVDAKGVSRLYQHSVRTRDLLLLVLAAIFTLTVVFVISEPMRLVVRAFWLTLIS